MRVKNLVPAILSVIIIIAATFSTADAQTIHGKAHHEKHRIHHGVKSGKISKAERKWLKHEQRRIHRKGLAYKRNDGRLDRCERRDLKKDQRRASRHIAIAKHNKR